jgi:hypothetical protein
MVVSDEMFHAINGRLPVVTNQIVSIEVVPLRIQPIKTLFHSIRIQHGHNHNLEVFS